MVLSFFNHLHQVHAQSDQKLSSAVVQLASKVTTLVILTLEQTERESAKLFGLPQHIGISFFKLLGSYADLGVECFGQSTKTLLTLVEGLIGASAFDAEGELASNGQAEGDLVV